MKKQSKKHSSKSDKAGAERPLGKRKRHIFAIGVALIPLLFFLLLELGLQAIQYGGNLKLFISLTGPYSDYLAVNPSVGKRFFFTQVTVPTPSNDVFLKKKPENGYRIFVLGGSTTIGYPYGPNLMFSRLLHLMLNEIFPDRHIEVVNVAMTAVNSYAYLDYLDEILAQDPDAILIYGGHNEFYGALGVASAESLGKFRWVVKAYLKLKKYRTFLLLRDGIARLRIGLQKWFGGDSVEDPSATLMERMVAEQQIAYGSPLYRMGLFQFEANIRELLQRCQQNGVQVVLSELVSNIRDLPPFESIPADTLPPADEVYQQARQLDRQGQFRAAREKYYRAKDLDALRFRASEDLNAIIHRLAQEYQIPVVPMKAFFEKAARDGLIGNDLMTDHLHPNIKGYFIMADAFLRTLKQNGLIASSWRQVPLKRVEQRIQSRCYTALDSIYGEIRIRILKGGWPFKKERGPNQELLNFKPRNMLERLAFRAWVAKDYSLEKAHVDLASLAEQQRDYATAIREYQALICLTPYNASPYLKLANVYIVLGKLNEALPYLYRSLELEPTAFAYKWVGQILLERGRAKEALPYLEKARKRAPDDPQLLYNLSGAYALNQRFSEAMKTILEAEKIDPDFPDLQAFKQQLKEILEKQQARVQ
ncbi:MAG: tetratricopeptide repeat protein [Calditrichaeota bacterium]|nr:tetratricopeptide repeat protein [Calditrichota bacterium]